MKLIQIVS